MSLAPGVRLGPYEVTGTLGAGGMGEVYRARDTQLNRDVALKVLPGAFAADQERIARFAREAQALAALNHPNIAQVYGLAQASGHQAIAMELVEGDDLAERIARGPMRLDDVLAVARQIADALEAAHEAGIVHRDLKPANIKVRDDGTVKVLDFGLARPVGPESASAAAGEASGRPTMTSPAMTAMGVILGTAAYMSPEQARGRTVDKRADIWAFGVVLCEMITGKPLFAGDTVSDVLAAVLTREPDWGSLPVQTPAAVRRLLERCLERDPRKRLRDIGDARWDLQNAAEPVSVVDVSAHRSMRAWLPWALAVALAAVAGWALWSRPPVPSRTAGHFAIELPEEAPLVTLEVPGTSEGPLVVSPDGRQVVYVAPNGSATRLYVRAMTDLTPRALPGTEGATAPFFSHDGQWVGFFADGKLKKTPLAGGTPVTLAEAPRGSGGSWGPQGEIIFAPTGTSGLFAVPDTGGTPRSVTTLDFAVGDDAHGWPQVLTGHRLALFTVSSWSRETWDIALVDLTTGERRVVLSGVGFARYVPAAPGAGVGHLVFVQGGALMAAPFDPAGGEGPGPPVAVVDGVRSGQFDVSANGVLAYAPGAGAAPDFSLVWVDRSGVGQPMTDLARGYEDLHLSPDGRRVALTIEEAGPESAAHVWLADTDRGTLTRLTFEGFSRDPVWAPDGESVVFGSKRGDAAFALYRQRVDGQTPAELLWASPIPIWPDPQSWTPDGRQIVFTVKGKSTGDDIWVLPLDADRVARPWLQTKNHEWAGRLSPDGKWMAYNSDESGRTEVYVQPFPGPGGKRLVSEGGGFNAIWSRDGRKLFYRQADRILEVDVETSEGFTVGKPAVLFAGRYRATGRDFDVSPDGTRFVLMRNDDPRTTTTVNVLLDWWSALESRLSAPQP